MIFKNEYDVIIVGAGPGGAAAARKCAEGGLSVLLLEKRQEIGAPKRCGEGLGLRFINHIGFNGDEGFVTNMVDSACIVAPKGKEIIATFPHDKGCILERKLFDKALCYKAAEAGAKIIAKAAVIDVLKENGKIMGVIAKIDGKSFEIKSKLVIAADGVESKIARMAGLDTKNRAQDIDSGFQYEMAGIEIKNSHRIYIYFGNSIAPRGYIWIFPKGKTVANVGIGIAGHNKKTAKEYLDEWIETQPGIKKGSIIEVNSGGIPVGGLLKKMTLDNFMVVGDAAHQVNPLHGGGIDEATIAGEIAAQIAIKAITKGDTTEKALQEYNDLWWKTQGKNLEKIEKYRNLVEKLTDDDMDILAEAISGTALLDFAVGKGETLVKTLMKNPKLFKLARHLI